MPSSVSSICLPGELYLLATKDTVKDISLYASGLFIGFTDKIYEALKDFEA